MTDLAVLAPTLLALLTALAVAVAGARRADAVNAGGSCLTAAAALVLCAVAAVRHDDPVRGAWYALDAAGGAFLAVIAVVGLLSALASPSHLRGATGSFFGTRAPRRSYYVALQCFWAVLLAIPLVDNLAVGWILIEATTAFSALLVASGGRRRALEAGWKYLVLTTLGLTVALLGILVLYVGLGSGASLARLDFTAIRAAARAGPRAGRARARAHPRRPGDEDRLGAGAQLAARCAQRGAAARQRTAVGGPAADRHARRLAHPARAGPRGRRRGRGGVRRVRARVAARWRCRSCGARCRSSGCSPTRASSTWASWPSGSASPTRWPPPG